MPVWRTRPVEEQSTLTLEAWKVIELPGGDRHLVGYCIENREGRVSSVIRDFDPSSLRAKTKTGRVYRLRGGPGANLDAEYVWGIWARVNFASSWTDVTELAWNEHLAVSTVRPSVESRYRRRRRGES